MNKALWFFGASILAGSAVVAASNRSTKPVEARPAASSAPAPAAPAVADGSAALLQAQLADLQAKNEDLMRRVAELEPLAKLQAGRLAEESDPYTKPFAGTKLMDDALREKLKLTTDQELAMRAAVLKFLKESNDARARKDLTAEQKEAEVERLRQLLEADFAAVLDPGQHAELTSERQSRKTKARDAAIAAEAPGYAQFFGFDASAAAAFDRLVKAWYEANPQQKPGYKWQYDPHMIEQILAIPGLTAEQQQKAKAHFERLNSKK